MKGLSGTNLSQIHDNMSQLCRRPLARLSCVIDTSESLHVMRDSRHQEHRRLSGLYNPRSIHIVPITEESESIILAHSEEKWNRWETELIVMTSGRIERGTAWLGSRRSSNGLE